LLGGVSPTIAQTSEAVSETASEPAPEQATEEVTEEVTEPATDETTEPAVDPELTSEPTSEQEEIEPTGELVTEPMIEPMGETTAEPITDQVIEPAIEQTAEPITNNPPEQVTEPTIESSTREPEQTIEDNRNTNYLDTNYRDTDHNAFLFQNLRLSPGFNPDPQWLRGVAGGEETAIAISDREQTPTGACAGFINTLPNHRLTLDQVFYSLRVRVKSEGDTTIIIRGPGGVWCNDDYDGSNAGIAGQWLAGNYEIWVGAYTEDTFLPYELEVSEVVLPRADRDRDLLFRSP